MSDQPPVPSQYDYDARQYADYRPYGSAPTLVKVAAILNFVMAGIDILYGLSVLTFGVLTLTGVIPRNQFDDPPGSIMIGGIFSVVSLLPLFVGLIKSYAGLKLIRLKPGAAVWGLTAGILGCTQLWCVYFCVLPMGIGIYTIVAMCIENVKRYLRDSAAQTS